ncbi:MAG TPA: hydrogenase maturation protease [Jatrophihabitans sp.]|jgi:hydrogenase maturation protease
MRTLVAGVGNIFLGDDAFGCEVVRRMAGRPLPDGVEITDFGIRGVHLAYQLLDGYDLLVLVDAAPRGRQPGTVSLLEVELDKIEKTDGPLVDAHGMEPVSILSMLASLGGNVKRVLVVACEPQSTVECIGLSAAVGAAVDPAVEIVQKVISGADETLGEVSNR